MAKAKKVALPFPFSDPVASNETTDFRCAIYDFVSTFAVPALPVEEGHLLWARQNDMALPDDGNDIILCQILLNERVGTGHAQYDLRKDGEDVVYLRETVRSQIQIDCYAENSDNTGDDIPAMLRAQALETAARSSQGVRFLRDRGVDLLYADGVKDLGTVNESGKYQPRWTLVLHVSYQVVLRVSQAYFDCIEPIGIHNVDAEYPPK